MVINILSATLARAMKWLLPVAVVALAMLAEVTLGRASGGPDFALFFGRFHPLVVHLPIGFFLLVAMGEAATFVPKLRERVEPALGLLIPVSALAALAAFLMGQLLALEGGFPAGALGWHRRLTLIAIIGMAGCWVLFDRQREKGGNGRLAYRGVMAATLGVLSLGAHFGGTMTRGESYLSKYAPGPLKPLLGTPEVKKETAKADEKPAAPTSEPLVYQDVLLPALKLHCGECHGADKQKGKLRIDSLEELMKGGESGPAVVAGQPKKSPLLARMLLRVNDDERMPPNGKLGLKLEAQDLLEFWIARGASPTLKVKDVLAPASSRALLEHALGAAAPSDSVPVSAPGHGEPAAPSPAGDDSSTPAAMPPPAAAATPNAAAPSEAGTATQPLAPTSAGKAADTAPPEAPTPAPPPPAAGATSGPAFLAMHCEKCHGGAKQKGKLRVDSVAALLKGGANGAALVQGSPDKSSIVQRVKLALSNDEHMPPAKEPQPTPAEIAVLVSWVRSGASSSVAAKPSGGASLAAASTSGAGSSGTPSGAASGATSGAASGATSGASTSPSATAGETPVAATPTAPAAGEAPAPATAADVSGPADPAVLKDLPDHVALFTDAVKPLLHEKCGKCHIKDKPAGGLGLAEHAQLLEGGFSGPAIVPKDRKASFLMQRLVLPPSDDEHMPPEGEPVLSADEVELVGSWIDQGAPASAPTETAKLTAGAARALSARGIKGTGQPPAVSAQAGGCAACSVPGAPQSKWLGLQTAALLAAASIILARRATRRATR